MRSAPRGSLERHLPQAAPSNEEMMAMRRAAWRLQAIAVIRPADVQDEWLRQAVINLADRLYGRQQGS